MCLRPSHEFSLVMEILLNKLDAQFSAAQCQLTSCNDPRADLQDRLLRAFTQAQEAYLSCCEAVNDMEQGEHVFEVIVLHAGEAKLSFAEVCMEITQRVTFNRCVDG